MGSTKEYSPSWEPLLSSLPALQSPLREPSLRRPSQPPWPGVVAGLSEALMPTLESFPHQIMLTREVGGSLMCGGSIVGSNKVITAGHCCDGMSASKLGVEVGSHNLYEDDP